MKKITERCGWKIFLLCLLLITPLMSMEAAPDYGAKMYSFAVVSDIHVLSEKATEPYESGFNYRGGIDDWKRTLKIMELLQPDFLAFTGDIGMNSTKSELELYQRIVKRWAKVPVYGCTGNHDSGFSDADWKAYTGWNRNFVFTHHDDVFIFMSIDQGSLSSNRDSRSYYAKSLSWLKQTLDLYKGRRIFLHTHIPLPKTSGLPQGVAYGYSTGGDAESNTITNYIGIVI